MDRTIKAMLGVTGLGVWSLLAYVVGANAARAGAGSGLEHLTLAELTVERVNVVDSVGKVRVVISGPERFPNPVVAGKEYPRSIKPGGLVFYKSNGDEAGGIGLIDVGKQTKNFMMFDYSNSEALGLGISEVEGGAYAAGITLLDRVALDADIARVGSVGKERISIGNENGAPRVILSDSRGQQRVRLYVDASGAGKLEIRDADGKVVFSVPE